MKKLLTLTLLTLTISVFAMEEPILALGDREGNGGDSCERQIITIRDDIKSWILNGGPRDLELPKEVTVTMYSTFMLESLLTANVSCTTKELYIGDAQKSCVNFKDHNGVKRIICNHERFNEIDIEQQYRLVHHEYAGMAGLETNSGEESNYFITNQISAYLEETTIKRLALKKVKMNNSCAVYINLEEGDIAPESDLLKKVSRIIKDKGYPIKKNKNDAILYLKLEMGISEKVWAGAQLKKKDTEMFLAHHYSFSVEWSYEIDVNKIGPSANKQLITAVKNLPECKNIVNKF